jgi:integrase
VDVVADSAFAGVEAIADEYMKRHALPKKRSADQDQRKLNADVLPELGTQFAAEISKSDIVALLDKIVDRGAPVGANRTLALLRKLYNWAMAEGYIASNPASGIPMRAKEESRSRVLSDNEIVSFWNALDGPGFDRITADVLRFQLLVGARIREVTGLERAELDLDSAIPIWVLPKRRAKAGRDIVRPLPPLALLIVKRQKGDGKFVFTSPANNKQPITPRAPARAVQRAAVRGLVPSGFTPHDLRRTAATKLAALGVEEAVTKRILGHAPMRSDVLASVYNRHSYVAEMCAALETLERHLLHLVFTPAEVLLRA